LIPVPHDRNLNTKDIAMPTKKSVREHADLDDLDEVFQRPEWRLGPQQALEKNPRQSTARDIANFVICAWEGCMQTFKGDMPDGWSWATAYWAPRPPVDLSDPHLGWIHDKALCPQHTVALGDLFKDRPARSTPLRDPE
jgi:hypothetical protein